MQSPGASSSGASSSLPESIAYTNADGKRGVYRLETEPQSSALYENPRSIRSQFSLFSSASSEATLPNLVGPGRILGNLLEGAGRRVEKNIGVIAYKAGLHPAVKAEQRLEKWVPGNEEDDTYLLTCAAKSEHPIVQRRAFKLYIDFVIHHKTWHWLNNNHSLETYYKVMNSFTKAVESDPTLSISRSERKEIQDGENWTLYYEAARYLWTSEDVDPWVATQLRKLKTANVEWMSKYQPYERLLVYLIASWSCNEPDAWITLPYGLFLIAINQTGLGSACEDREGVDLLSCAVITRMLRDFTDKLDATYDDSYAIENFFKLIDQIRRYSAVFRMAFKQLQNDASRICSTFVVGFPESDFESAQNASKHVRPLMDGYRLRTSFVRAGSKWTVKPWTVAEERNANESSLERLLLNMS